VRGSRGLDCTWVFALDFAPMMYCIMYPACGCTEVLILLWYTFCVQYVCMYECMYVSMYVCMYVLNMYICMYVCMCACVINGV
jgi:hypothetical protein